MAASKSRQFLYICVLHFSQSLLMCFFGIGTVASWLGLWFGSWLQLVLGLEGNQTIASKENCLPVRVRVWVRVSFGVGEGQFFVGAIVLEP